MLQLVSDPTFEVSLSGDTGNGPKTVFVLRRVTDIEFRQMIAADQRKRRELSGLGLDSSDPEFVRRSFEEGDLFQTAERVEEIRNASKLGDVLKDKAEIREYLGKHFGLVGILFNEITSTKGLGEVEKKA